MTEIDGDRSGSADQDDASLDSCAGTDRSATADRSLGVRVGVSAPPPRNRWPTQVESLSANGRTSGHWWLEEPDGRRWYTVWEPEIFADAITRAGFGIDQIDPGPYVEVWATR
ncbi:hypothetical protein [Streptomyces decoyicus]|uniref:hypothetical protein n=1 Tax=Streptomyces decoyicus TaxID=249567 RepID=UPI003813F1C1